MKLKRLIAFTVVMAVIMSCFTTVFAADPTIITKFDGIWYKKEGSTYTVGTYYSRLKSGNTYPEWILNLNSGNAPSSISYVYPKSGQDCPTNFALAGDGYNYGTTGVVRYLSGDENRGNYYEVSYSLLRGNVYNDIRSCAVCSSNGKKVLGYSFYIMIPEESATVTKSTKFAIQNDKDHYYATKLEGNNVSNASSFLTNYFVYDGSSYDATQKKGKISYSFEGNNMEKIWGNEVLEVEPDKWYKVELRAFADPDTGYKVGVGVYYDDVQVAYYAAKKTATDKTFDEHMTIHQVDFYGSNTKTSPGKTYYDDITYAFFALEDAPSKTPITLSADEGSRVATAKILGSDDITDARLVVALYNGDTFAGVASNTLEEGSRTITCSFPTGVNYTKYKLFLFDNYTSLTPLTNVVGN